MKFYIARKSIVLNILIILSALTSGCYENFLTVNSNFSRAIPIDDHKIAFFHFIKAGQPPKGLSRFPDGGSNKIVYSNTSLYAMDTINLSINKLYDFGSIPAESGWTNQICYNNSKLLFAICPTSGWQHSLKYHSNDTSFLNYYDHISGFYIFNANDNNLTHIKSDGYNPALSPSGNEIIYLMRDSVLLEIWHMNLLSEETQLLKTIHSNTAFIKLFWINDSEIAFSNDNEMIVFNSNSKETYPYKEKISSNNSEYITIKKVTEFTSNIRFKNWGLNIIDKWPKTKKDYINDIIYLNGNFNYRKAIVQELNSELNSEDITYILEQMNKYENDLQGYEQSEYSIFSQETKDLLKSLLN